MFSSQQLKPSPRRQAKPSALPAERAIRRDSARAEGGDVADRLARDGYVLLSRSDYGAPELTERAIAGLAAATEALPPDPYCSGNFRFRRYARLFIQAWNGTITTAPTASDDNGRAVQLYQQPASLNVEEDGVGRWFPAIDGETLESDWLQHIIRFDFAQLAFTAAERSAPIQIGVHLVESRPSRNEPAVASPNLVHRDGEYYTCAHLIERAGVVGGENHIVDPGWANSPIGDVPQQAIRAAFTLWHPLEGYIVRDDRVAHHVDPVLLDADAERGARKMLLIDFTPMRPDMLTEIAAR